MKKCCFVIPYFGRFPDYFPLFLKSCSYNEDFNWLIFTDDKTPYNYPPNFRIEYIEFNELRVLISSKFDFEISLNQPYKLCDYKPAYGYIFEDYLKNFKSWGYCDVDMLFGHLNDFLTDGLIETYDKIFSLGHLAIYKNTKENNSVFMDSYKGRLLYKEIFTSEHICIFDEEGKENNINTLFIERNKPMYLVDHSLNINPNRIQFRRAVFKGRNEMTNRYGFETEPYRHSVYMWDNGYVNRYYLYDHELIKSNCAYIHLQKRKMSFEKGVENSNCIQIIPNEFITCNSPITSFKDFSYDLLKTYTFKYIRRRIKEILAFDIYQTMLGLNFKYKKTNG